MERAKRIVISVPPRELGGYSPRASLFEIECLNDAPISPALRSAIGLIVQEYGSELSPPLCVARPEIFTNGMTRDWLAKKLGNIQDHISLSDGATIKLIPGLSNHLFAYGQHRYRNSIAFHKLSMRVPEVFAQLKSQINSFQSVIIGKKPYIPPIKIMPLTVPVVTQPLEFHRFYLDRHSLENSAGKVLALGPVAGPACADFERILYIPLTETAARDPSFCRVVAQEIEKVYFNLATCLIIRLPAMDQDLSTTAERIVAALGGICDGRINFPRVPAANILFVTEDVPEDFFHTRSNNVSIFIHGSFDFWRHTRKFYSKGQRIIYFPLRRQASTPAQLKKALVEAFGVTPELRRASPVVTT